MAKYRFYVDIYKGVDPTQYGLLATTRPGVKIDGAKRIAFNVEIPEYMMFEVDDEAIEVSRVVDTEDFVE